MFSLEVSQNENLPCSCLFNKAARHLQTYRYALGSKVSNRSSVSPSSISIIPGMSFWNCYTHIIFTQNRNIYEKVMCPTLYKSDDQPLQVCTTLQSLLSTLQSLLLTLQSLLLTLQSLLLTLESLFLTLQSVLLIQSVFFQLLPLMINRIVQAERWTSSFQKFSKLRADQN